MAITLVGQDQILVEPYQNSDESCDLGGCQYALLEIGLVCSPDKSSFKIWESLDGFNESFECLLKGHESSKLQLTTR